MLISLWAKLRLITYMDFGSSLAGRLQMYLHMYCPSIFCPCIKSQIWPDVLTLATHSSLYPAPAAFLASKPLCSSASSTNSCDSVKPTTADLPSLTDWDGAVVGVSVDEV